MQARPAKDKARPVLVDLLLENQKVEEKDLEKIYQLQSGQNLTIEMAAIQSGVVDAQIIAELYSEYYEMPLLKRDEIDLSKVEEIRSLFPEKLLRDQHVLPLSSEENTLNIALVDPSDIPTLQELHLYQSKNLQIHVGVATDIDQILDELYGSRDVVAEISSEGSGPHEDGEDDEDEEEKEKSEVVDLNKIIPEGKDTQVLRIVNHILKDSVDEGASDIHMEPFQNTCKIRFRIDGRLNEITPPPRTMFMSVISRIKILSKMDIAEKRIPQDGAFTLRYNGQEIDMRVSTVPVVWGEKVVMRLLRKDAINIELKELGFSERQYKDFMKGASNHNGLILVTGPTGSGKSTTLYALMNLLKSPKTNISTIEDPVEYKVEGLNQVQVRANVGLTFASGLRAFLRQDPDIILVGEVRDNETAQICMKAALTGHLVLSTLHTNDALSSIARLKDMGVEPFVIASVLRLAEAQRLIRRLCPDCKEPFEVDAETAERFSLEQGQTLYRAKGCPKCKDLGYKGRVGVFEVVFNTPGLRDMIQENAPIPELKEEAEKQGMLSLASGAKEKVLEGITSLEELISLMGGGE